MNNGIFKEISKRGHDIPGGLTGLAAYVSQHPDQFQKITKPETYKGKKAIPINREVFYACVRPIEYQETL